MIEGLDALWWPVVTWYIALSLKFLGWQVSGVDSGYLMYYILSCFCQGYSYNGKHTQVDCISLSGIILWMGPANERRCYIVMASLIGWAYSQNDPWIFRIFWYCLMRQQRWQYFIWLTYFSDQQMNLKVHSIVHICAYNQCHITRLCGIDITHRCVDARKM